MLFPCARRRVVARFEALLNKATTVDLPLRVAVVGGGASGVELACALQYRSACMLLEELHAVYVLDLWPSGSIIRQGCQRNSCSVSQAVAGAPPGWIHQRAGCACDLPSPYPFRVESLCAPSIPATSTCGYRICVLSCVIAVVVSYEREGLASAPLPHCRSVASRCMK